MNIYTTDFFAKCPSNGIRIAYRLRIEIGTKILAEDILSAVQAIGEGYHEAIADDLLGRFGGTQTLVANHHGVTIETVRA